MTPCSMRIPTLQCPFHLRCAVFLLYIGECLMVRPHVPESDRISLTWLSLKIPNRPRIILYGRQSSLPKTNALYPRSALRDPHIVMDPRLWLVCRAVALPVGSPSLLTPPHPESGTVLYARPPARTL